MDPKIFLQFHLNGHDLRLKSVQADALVPVGAENEGGLPQNKDLIIFESREVTGQRFVIEDHAICNTSTKGVPLCD